MTKSVIRTPDQRLRVFVSSTLQELAEERRAAREAIEQLHLAPVMFELGARPHPPKELYRAYLDQSHIFIGIYWQKYGWVAPDMDVSGLEDEYNLSAGKPKLIYIKSPAPDREARLKGLLDRIKGDNVSYKYFGSADELRGSIADDLMMMLTEHFEMSGAAAPQPIGPAAPSRPALPTPPTPLIGRDRELTDLLNLICAEEAALITLTGPGGTGKSRLALQVALETTDHFSDGVYFVALAPISDPQLVAPTIAHTLGLREAPDSHSIEAALLNYLRDKHVLLLLDNFEQVFEAAPVVADLLQACSRLKIIVTSRAPLRLRGEREWPVATLALPDIKHLPELTQISQYAAVQLFIQRARDVKPDFTVTNENAPAVAEICYRLDGLPLAIELAAARIKLLTPQAMLTRLDHRLPLLTGGARDLPVRQQTLRSAIEWSYNLLDDQARTLFRRLAVFVAGWTLAAIEHVCNFDGELGQDVLDELEYLVDNSLLRRTETPDGEVRFSMLATIREYAWERLNEANEVDELRLQHAQYYLELVEETIPYQFNRFPESWMLRLIAENDNLRAAVRWISKSADDSDMMLRMVYAAAWFWFLNGQLSEGYAWCRAALERTAAKGDTLARGKAFLGAGGLGFTIGKYVEARDDLAQSIAIARRFNEPQLLSYALTYYGLILTGLGDYAAAMQVCRENLELTDHLQHDWPKALTLRILGDNEVGLNGVEAARPWYAEAIRLARRIGDPWLLAISLRSAALVDAVSGDFELTRTLFEESIALSRKVGDRWGLSYNLVGYGYAAVHAGRIPEAQRLLREGYAMAREVDSVTALCLTLIGFAGLATACQDAARAARLFGAADGLLATITVRWWPTEALVYHHFVSLARAQLDEATWTELHTAGRALSLSEAIALAQETAGPLKPRGH